uniref:Ubiquitinyl hydrolase 1 n=1 Tax=Alexandrium monilatum TaxID=311494 RepID=A0A7S4SKG3_9DINO
MAPLEGGLLAEVADAHGEEAHYAAHREELLEALRGGRARLEPRGEGGVGLLNQGATCYMNSLLQALFRTPEFRQLLYRWRFDQAMHGDPARCIPLQLQRLFAQLQIANVSAVSTKPLTAAFGFSDAESREQHDVQELCRLLFDALGRSAAELEEEINRLYAGKTTHFLRSREAAEDGHVPESRRDEKFLDLQVPIEGCSTLEEALQRLVEVEVLNGDNQWFCDELGRKVDAEKGVSFGVLPSVLCLQLLRFVFDLTTMRRRKLTEALSIPLEADFSFLLGAPGSGRAVFALTAICCHSGTAHGGHYHAFIREGKDGTWRDANDAAVRVVGPDHERGLFPPRKAAGTDGTDAVVEGPNAMSSSDAYFLVYRRTDREVPEVPDESVPEPHRSELLEENTRWAALQRAYQLHRQLMEIKVYAPIAPQLALRRHVAQQLRGLVSEEQEAAAGIREPPAVVLNVHSAKSVAAVQQQASEAFIAQAERDGEPWPWAMLLSLNERSKGSRSRLRRYEWCSGEARMPLSDEMSIAQALRSSEAIGSPNAPVVLEVRSFGEEFEEWGPSLHRVIVVRWDPANRAIGLETRDVVALRLPQAPPRTAPAPAAQAPTAAEGGNATAEVPAAAADTDAFDEEAMPSLFDNTSPTVPAAPAEDTTPSVGAVRAAAAAAFGLEGGAALALVAMTGSHAGQPLLDDEQTLLQALRDGYGQCGNGDIICAEVAPTDGGKPQSAVLYEEVRNTAHLSFNHPDRPEFTEECSVSISMDATLAELKAKIAQQLGLDAGQLHFARAHKAPQLKDETKTLRTAGLAGSSHIFVGHGAPCGVDENLLRVALYCPAEKGGGAAKARDALSHAAKGASSIRSLREALVTPLLRWCQEVQASGSDAPFASEGLQWKRLRIRDGQAGKHFAILRDDRTVRSSLLGLVDGRQVAVQVLDRDEELTPDDLILHVRPWRYETGSLFAATEWVFRKTRTIAELREELTARFRGILEDAASATSDSAAADGAPDADAPTQEDRLELAALPSAGPPLTVKRCASLKWVESPLNAAAAEDLQRPLAEVPEVRDGATIVLRSALRASRGPPAEAAKGGGKGPGAPGTALPKAKAGAKARASSLGTAASRRAAVASVPARRERALVIEVAHPDAAKDAAAEAAAEAEAVTGAAAGG